VFVVLPQRLGSDVREGKRRHFNYIGEKKHHFYVDELLSGMLSLYFTMFVNSLANVV